MIEEISVLVIEEREQDFLKLKDSLDQQTDWKTSTIWAKSYSDGLHQFKNLEIDICFLDAKLGQETGHNFLDQLKGLKHHIPIILVGHANDARARELDEKDGIDDFLRRENLSPLMVSKSLRYGIESYKSITQLRIQKEKYNKLFYGSLEAVFTADKNYKILQYNDVFKNLLKISDMEDFDFRSLFVESNYELIFQSLSELPKKKLFRTKIKDAEGNILDVYVSISRILYSEDDTSFQGLIHDITELEKAQNEIIAADKLKLMSRMARILGHEVRNPLSNILLAAEELKADNAENEDMIFMLGMIDRNAKRISGLVDSFLNNTRHSELQTEKLPIEGAIIEAIKNCEDRIALKKINFITYGINAESTFLIDQQKIVIALTNILINAVEALESTREPKLYLNLKIDSDKAIITIKDNGSGMTKEVQDNLFTPFYSSKQGGLGLGMVNTKNIFDLHKAQIEVDSEVKVGTTFLITIPKDTSK